MKRFQRELKYGKFINLPIVSVISDLMFSEDVKFPECKSHNFWANTDKKVFSKNMDKKDFCKNMDKKDFSKNVDKKVFGKNTDKKNNTDKN